MTRLPMRKDLEAWLQQRQTSCNVGLLYQRFPCTWSYASTDKQTSFTAGGTEKKEFFQKMINIVRQLKNGEGKASLEAVRARRRHLLETLKTRDWRLGKPIVVRTQWRLVSGLGMAHPYETGFVFDHIYGVPYLPGSSVKGAARAWAEETGWTYPECEAIFGPDEHAPNLHNHEVRDTRGYVTFFDAYPMEWPELEIDIINPHYSEYYEGTQPPADWLSPKPTYFLALGANTQWEFQTAVPPMTDKIQGLVCVQAKVKCPQELADKAGAIVSEAAKNLGLGGKTAVGYGYFE